MNFIKSIFSHTFDSPLAMANTLFIITAFIVLIIVIIFTIGYIIGEVIEDRDYYKKLIEPFRLKNLKSTFFKMSHIENLTVTIICSVVVYIVLLILSIISFIISTIWVEYPCYGTLYTRDGGQWNKHEGRLYHFPFAFDGRTVLESNYSGTAYLEVIFRIKYHINKSDDSMQTVLKNLTSIPFTLDKGITDFIQNKFKVLLFSADHKDLVDPKIRLKIFQDFYAPYGITIDSVETL